MCHLSGRWLSCDILLCVVRLREDVRVAFFFEMSMLYGRWHVKWNESDKRVNFKGRKES